ncbi:MAG: 4-(cytidine 5'-diphospho)-2-C-methyl-D-erythritol kinase, partial [Oceanobacter sp.]
TAVERGGRNDCQPVASMLYPEIGNALKLLSNFTLAKMTGSGSCVFGSFNSESEALNASMQIPAEFSSYVTKGVNRSPTHRLLFRPS